MSYRDKTFCASPNCKNDCGRQLTDEIRQGARASNQLLSLAYFCGAPELDESVIIKTFKETVNCSHEYKKFLHKSGMFLIDVCTKCDTRLLKE